MCRQHAANDVEWETMCENADASASCLYAHYIERGREKSVRCLLFVDLLQRMTAEGSQFTVSIKMKSALSGKMVLQSGNLKHKSRLIGFLSIQPFIDQWKKPKWKLPTCSVCNGLKQNQKKKMGNRGKEEKKLFPPILIYYTIEQFKR